MTVTIDPMDVQTMGVDVASLLQRAWAPPCLWYASDYLRWEFAPASAPAGAPAAIALGAFEKASVVDGDARLVGFIGAVRRRGCIGTWIGDVWLLSFLAVLPEYRRRRIGRRLYTEFFSAVHGTPVVTFTRHGTPGDLFRAACLAAVAPASRALRMCRTYGHGRMAPEMDGGAYSVEPVTEYATWMQLLGAKPPPCDQLIAWPDPAAFAHARQDPRGRTFHLVRDADGRPVAGAAAFHQETRTVDGVSRTPSVECVVLHEPSPSIVATLIRHAGIGLGQRQPSPHATRPPIMLMPNASMVEEAVLRPAGLRATRAEFLAHVAGPPDHPVLSAACTNFEVV